MKASIECGLAEMMRRGEAADKDSLQPRTLDLAELYSMLPTEIQDPSFQPITQKVSHNHESLKYVSCILIHFSHTTQNSVCLPTDLFNVESCSCLWVGKAWQKCDIDTLPHSRKLPTDIHTRTFCLSLPV